MGWRRRLAEAGASAAAAEAAPARILGELQQGQDGFLHGWCWSPDAPAARQVVQIATGRRIITTIVAARFRTDLRDHGIGDGYHGFTVSAAKTLRDDPDARIITAREANTAAVFGRIVRADAGFALALQRRLASVADRLARIDAQIGRLNGPPRSVLLQDGVRRLGLHLLAQGGVSPAVQPSNKIALAAIAAPALSVIGWAADWRDATARLQATAPALNAADAEMLFIDPGHDARLALLPGQAPNLRYVNGRGGSLATCLARAIRLARAERIVVLDGLGRQAGPLPPAEAGLLIGSSIAAMLRQLLPEAASGMTEIRQDSASGLCFGVPRAVLAELGGVDEAIGGWSGLAILDLVLRARAHGVPVMALCGPWRAGPGSALFRDVDRAAFGVFAARWGLPA